jgi:hypothetical protein
MDPNIASIQNQIFIKKGYYPHYGTLNEAESVITDMDHFPYTRFFRGVYHSSNPIVFEREAGWRPTRNNCYKGKHCIKKNSYPNNCWEYPCSTVLPCYQKTDTDAIRNQCVTLYR